MAEITKQALKVDNNSSFPNNNAGAITPAILRAFNVNMIDSMVDEIGYNVDSASWNQQIDSLENFTASLSTAFVSTASFNAYTSSTNGRLNNIESTTASLNISVSQLNASSASQQISINALNTFTASAATSAITASSLITASFNNGTRDLTFTKGDASTFAVNIPDVSGSTINTGSFVTTSSFNAYTASQSTASLVTSITELNTFSASALVSISNLNQATASYVTETESGSFLITASFDNGNRNLTFTKGNNTTFAVNIPDVSGSAGDFVTTSSFNSYTASTDSRLTNIETTTASLLIETQNLELFSASALTSISNINQFTQSAGISINALNSATSSYVTESETASFARTNVDNNFSANQTFTNITATSASITYLTTLYETASVIYSSGSNQLGDELTDIQTLSGSVKVQGSLTVNGTPVLTSSVDISGLTTTASFNAYTQSNDSKVNSLINATASYATSAITASSLITASAVGNTITFTKGDASTFNVSVVAAAIDTGSFATTASFNAYTQSNDQKVNSLISVTGSYATTGSNVFVGNQTITGSINISGSINMVNGADLVTHHVRAQGSNGLELQTSAGTNIVQMGAGGGTQAVFVGALSANSFSSSTINGLGDPLVFSTSVDSRLDSLQTATASLFTSASLALYTASVSGQTMTFTKGDATTFNVTLPTGSGGGSIDTGSFATTGSNTFVADQTVSASIKVTGNVEMNQDSNAGILYPMSGSKSIRVQKQVGINRLSWVDQDNEKLLYLDIDTKNFFVSGGFSAKLQNGYAWVGQSDGRSAEIATSSFSGTTYINPTLNPYSGSLILVANTFTSSSFAHISASANGQVNLVFKNNDNTADTILSGSNNIFQNPAAPTAGFKRYIGGSNNIFLVNVPQISGSMQFSPGMTGNIGGGTYIMRGPVSSSTYTINTNYNAGTVNIGSSATLNAEKLTGGLSMTQNNIAGTLTIVANQSALTGSTTTVSSNTINGVVVLNLSSSAVSFQQSNINDGNFIFTNQFSSGALGIGLVSTSNNTIGGFGNTLIVTGSVLTGSLQPTMFNNLVIGATNTGFINTSDSRISGSSVYQNLLATSLLGNRLIVTGSSLGTDLNSFGSLFVGRWNANDGIKNKTSDVVFAVGTGISGSGTTGRKTGFLIDSGSNTFVEGTLNVSGATSLNGDLIITGSLTASLQQGYVWVGNASGITTTVATSSFGGGGAAFPYTGTAEITGSLIVSASYPTPIDFRVGTIDMLADTVTIGRFNGSNIDFDLATTINTQGDLIFNVGQDFKIYSQDLQLIGPDPFIRMANSNGGEPLAIRAYQNLITVENLNDSSRIASFNIAGTTLSGSVGHSITGSTSILGNVTVSGSISTTGSVSVGSVLSLGQLNPLPTGADGQLAVSASNLYFFSGSAWNKIAL